MPVADHDFTRLSLTPSVALHLNLPEDIEGSFYDGSVYITLKENCFEPSTPLRHIAELKKLFDSKGEDKPILCLYTDGGPDHRVTYLSVQLSLICYFLKANKDMIVAVRTPPYHSWKDPAERIMSILNLAMQGVGLMRQRTSSDELEVKLSTCNNMASIRKLADSNPHLEVQKEVIQSVSSVKELLGSMFERMKLNGQSFTVQESASEEEISSLWSEIIQIDEILRRSDTTKASIKNKTKIINFLETHCSQKHYVFFGQEVYLQAPKTSCRSIQ